MVVVEGKNSYFLGGRAVIVDNTTERAWAEKHIIHNDAHSYVLGKFVEADRANNNRQFFQMEGLRMGQPTIAHSPMNIDHHPGKIIGAYVASDFVYPVEGAADQNPYIEALGVVWKAHFPEEWAKIKEAHDQGSLFFSMECVPKQVGCIGEGGCGATFEYAGVTSDTYCEHINNRTSDRDLIQPHFTAGAILLPPVRPGWSGADIHSLVAQHAEDAERVLTEVASEADHLSAREWETIMAQFLALVSETGT